MKKKSLTKTARSKSGPKAPKTITPEVLDDLDREEFSSDDENENSDIEAEFESRIQQDSDDHQEVTTSIAHSQEIQPVEPGIGIPRAQVDLLKAYINEISKYPLLSSDEEYELVQKLLKTGDVNAAKKLVTANLRLVVKIAMEYRNAYQNVMDLIQEGNVGLMKAVSKYDPTKGAKLSYYSSWWIRSYILKYILDNFRLIRVGTTQAQKKLFFHLMREKEKLEAQGITPAPKLLADKLHVREQDIEEMSQRLSSRGAELSLNAPVGGASEGEGGERTSFQDWIVDQRGQSDEIVEKQELEKLLKDNLDNFSKTLKEKELAVFRERLAAEEPKTLQEVADQFGLTRERARQIEVQVIEKLRKYYKDIL